jgi:hypothetical protein
MAYRRYGAFIASVSVIALMLAASPALARSGAASSRGAFASMHHSISHRSLAQFRHIRRRNAGTLWPADDGSYGSSDGEPMVDAAQPVSGAVPSAYSYDIPWDWAHRFPPLVAPSERPYVPSCPTEIVTVAGRDGREQTVNVTRCY